MLKALIACRSVTYAQRAVRVLHKAGLKASMRRLPANLPEVDCGHAVRVDREHLTKALTLMNEAGFPSRVYFCEAEDGEVATCP